MKKFLFFLLLFNISILAQIGPKIEIVGGNEIDAGSHKRNVPLTYDVTVKNIGDQELVITGIQTSCGCSSALSSSNNVPPGQTAVIKFNFNGVGMGKVTKALMITTNEPNNPTHTVLISMNMVDPVTINPGSIIAEGKVGDELHQIASVLNSMDKDIDITEISSNTPVIKITSDKTTIKSGESASLDIAIKIYEESAINAAVFIKTSEGEFQIPILVDVKQ